METSNVVKLVISGIVILAVGFGFGIWYQSSGQPQKITQEIPPAVKVVSSKVTPSITAAGNIASIQDKKITVNNQGDTLQITVRDDAKIYNFSSVTGKSQQITLQDLKVGDNVSVNVKVTETGLVEAYTIIVLPPTAKPAAK